MVAVMKEAGGRVERGAAHWAGERRAVEVTGSVAVAMELAGVVTVRATAAKAAQAREAVRVEKAALVVEDLEVVAMAVGSVRRNGTIRMLEPCPWSMSCPASLACSQEDPPSSLS